MKHFYQLKITILLLTLIACRQNSELSIRDLKFPNYDKDQIAKNKIDTTYFFDESYFYLKANMKKYRGLEENFNGYVIYDKSGLPNQTEIFEDFGGLTITCRYDSIGLPIYKQYSGCAVEDCEITYNYFPNNLYLVQLWKFYNRYDTCIYKFNSNGLLIESVGRSDNSVGSSRHFNIRYFYNSNGQLENKVTKYVYPEGYQVAFEKNHIGPIPNSNFTRYYYSNTNLDSTITKYKYLSMDKWDYRSVTYYGDNGLKIKTVDRDSAVTIYRHVNSKGIVNNTIKGKAVIEPTLLINQ